MKLLFLLAAFVVVGCLRAQVVVPTTPTKLGTKTTGATSGNATSTITGGGSASVGVPKQTPPTIVRTTTYISLSDSRQWTSTDGKPLVAKLIAFEDIVVEEVKAAGATVTPSKEPPKLPEKPTVVKNGKVRLFAGKTPYEVPLDKLSDKDRAFIEGIQGVVRAKAP